MRKPKTSLRKLQLRITLIFMGLVVIVFLSSFPVVANTDSASANIEVPEKIKFKRQIESMGKAGVGPVIYPHKMHEDIYECSDCHPKVFEEKIGGNDINMQKNIDGLYCGSSGCHNSANAFPLYICENCHTEVTGASK